VNYPAHRAGYLIKTISSPFVLSSPRRRLYPPVSPVGEADGGQASRRPPGEGK